MMEAATTQGAQAAQAEATPASDDVAPRSTPDVWSRCPVGEKGLLFPTFNEIWTYSRMLVQAGMCIKGDTQSTVAAKITLGLELGLTTWAAVRGIAVVNGTPKVWGQVMLGLVLRSSAFDHDKWKEYLDPPIESGEWDKGEEPPDHYAAVCECARSGHPTRRRRFTVGMAKQANLWKRTSQGGSAMPWSAYARDMLMWRARNVLGDTFADVLQGMQVVEQTAADEVLSRIDIGQEQANNTAAGQIKREAATLDDIPLPEAAPTAAPAQVVPAAQVPTTDPPAKKRGRPRKAKPEAAPVAPIDAEPADAPSEADAQRIRLFSDLNILVNDEMSPEQVDQLAGLFRPFQMAINANVDFADMLTPKECQKAIRFGRELIEKGTE